MYLVAFWHARILLKTTVLVQYSPSCLIAPPYSSLCCPSNLPVLLHTLSMKLLPETASFYPAHFKPYLRDKTQIKDYLFTLSYSSPIVDNYWGKIFKSDLVFYGSQRWYQLAYY